MAEKVNPWLDEGNRYDKDNKARSNVRDLKFLDNKKHTVRVLPAKNPNEFPFHGYKQHWIPQNNSTVGKPITHGIDERCVACEWISTQWDEIHRLKEEEDMTDKSPEVEALLDKVGKIAGKARYDMNVIHREEPEAIVNEETGEKALAVKRMSVGGTVYKEIFGFAKKWGSPSNDKEGYDLEIKTSGEGKKREYSTLPDRVASPLKSEEIALLNKLYDLAALRKKSTTEEIYKILENAKAPYNEILALLKDVPQQQQQQKSVDSPETVEKEIEQAVNKKETKVTKQEPMKEAPVQKQETPKQEVPVTKTVTTPAPVDDEHNVEVYECKGDFDENDKLCSDCPVRQNCEEIHPFYVKAKQLGVNVDPHRSSNDVINDVKKQEKPEEPVAQASRRGKRIPF
jgi:hypothetical protein